MLVYIDKIHGCKNEQFATYDGMWKMKIDIYICFALVGLHRGELHLLAQRVVNNAQYFEIQEQRLATQRVARVEKNNDVWEQRLAN